MPGCTFHSPCPSLCRRASNERVSCKGGAFKDNVGCTACGAGAQLMHSVNRVEMTSGHGGGKDPVRVVRWQSVRLATLPARALTLRPPPPTPRGPQSTRAPMQNLGFALKMGWCADYNSLLV